jgi:hypothetical protein
MTGAMTGEVLMTEEEYYDSLPMPLDLVQEHMYIVGHGEPVEDQPMRIRAPWDPALTRDDIARFKQRQLARRHLRGRCRLLSVGRASRPRRSRPRVGTAASPARGSDPPAPPSRFGRALLGGGR